MDKTVAQSIYATSTVPMHRVGEKLVMNNGDIYRYAKAGGSNISKGKLQLSPVQKTNHHNCAVAVAAPIGSMQVTLTLGNTAAVANEYAYGMLVVNDATGEGQVMRIGSHPAADANGSLTVTLLDPVYAVALTTSSEATLVHNAWNGVVEGTTVTQRAAGVPLVDVTAGSYAWLKTRGVCPVLIGTAATLGADLIVGGTAGAVTDRTDALGASAEPVVAVADIVVGVSTEYNPVRLVID